MKKITDKMRLDWLENQALNLQFPGLSVGRIKSMGWGLYNANNVKTSSGQTAREVIDAGIHASQPQQERK